MRRVVYQTLLGAPFKVLGAASGIAGFVGSVWPEKVKAVLDSGSFPIQTASAVLLVGAVLYFALLWWLKPGERDEGGGTTQTTHGPHSPNFGHVGGNVTITHGAQDATQPSKSPYGSARPLRASEQARDEINRHLRIERGDPPWLETHRADPKPDLNFNGLMVRVYKNLGGSPPSGPSRKEFWGRVDREVADKMSLNYLHAWGRMSPTQALREIDSSAWAEGLFAHRDKALFVPNGLHTIEFSDLHFWKHEIDRIWPKPLETTNDGNP